MTTVEIEDYISATEAEEESAQRAALAAALEALEGLAMESDGIQFVRQIIKAFRAANDSEEKSTKEFRAKHAPAKAYGFSLDCSHIVASALHGQMIDTGSDIHPYSIASAPYCMFARACIALKMAEQIHDLISDPDEPVFYSYSENARSIDDWITK